ncbi:MAG: hypothetical protein K2X93_05235 [Candidatus Obscuribacterales bacterium]|nr:hypothetical protein [Candidatus Obscuribacterales bacterium]
MTERSPRSELDDLKIAVQVMGYDFVRLAVPVVATLVGVVTCACLFVWSVIELQKFSPTLAITHVEVPPEVLARANTSPVAAPPPPVAPRKLKKKERKVQSRQVCPTAPRARDYDFFFTSDCPKGGRIVRSDIAVTEYAWDQ